MHLGLQSIRHKTTRSILVLCIWEQGLHVVSLVWQRDMPLASSGIQYVSRQTILFRLCSIVLIVRPSLRSRNQGIRDDGTDPHLRRGAGLVRVRVCCYTAVSACELNL